MKCKKCEVCGQAISVSHAGTKQCLPVIIGTASGDSRHCWCICDDCKEEFIKRSARVFKELKESI